MSGDENPVHRLAAVVVELYGLLHPGAVASVPAIIDSAELLPGLVRQVIDERDLFRDQAIPEAAQIMNGLSAARRDAEAERDRLRAVVDAARTYVESEDDDQCADADYFRDGLIAALAELDGSEEIADGRPTLP